MPGYTDSKEDPRWAKNWTAEPYLGYPVLTVTSHIQESSEKLLVTTTHCLEWTVPCTNASAMNSQLVHLQYGSGTSPRTLERISGTSRDASCRSEKRNKGESRLACGIPRILLISKTSLASSSAVKASQIWGGRTPQIFAPAARYVKVFQNVVFYFGGGG